MNRRSFISTTSVGVAGLVLARDSFAAQPAPAAPPVTSFTELRRGVGMFIATGGRASSSRYSCAICARSSWCVIAMTPNVAIRRPSLWRRAVQHPRMQPPRR